MIVKIRLESLDIQIAEAISILLKMARQLCLNTFSDNYVFILTEIPNSIELTKKEELQNIISYENLIEELKSIYSNLYDVILQIYKSSPDQTTIEISYYPKSSLPSEFLNTAKDQEPMLHCQIPIPQGVVDGEKFDINWKHNQYFE